MGNKLSVNPTSREFLEEFFPEHGYHTICEIDLNVTTALVLHCSCKEKLGILPTTLERYGLTISKVLKGVLNNVPMIPVYSTKGA